MLNAIAGSDPADPATAEADARREDYVARLSPGALRGVRIGVMRFASGFGTNPALEEAQIARVRALRARREPAGWRASLDAVASAARGSDNLVPRIIAAVEAQATVGEIADTLREAFGEYREVAID